MSKHAKDSELRMSWRRQIARLRGLDEEIRANLEMEVEENRQAGLPTEEARYAARRKFGNMALAREGSRDMWVYRSLEILLQDVHFGLRMLGKNPGFTIVAVLTLALGIGASTAVFSVVNAVLLKPLPYPGADRIMMSWLIAPAGLNLGADEYPWNPRQFRMVLDESSTFQDLGAFKSDSFNLTGSGEPERLDGFRTSAGFFPALGTAPLLGRSFTPEEDQPGKEHEVILSHQLWRERFGGDEGILGRSIELNGYAYTVIGVMPSGFVFPRAEDMPVTFTAPRQAQLWAPLALPKVPGGPNDLAVIGRLKAGSSIEQARADLRVIAKRAEERDPRYKGWFNTSVTSLQQQIVGDTRRPLLLVLAAVGVVLLIACSNVASLMVTRSLGRKKEFTVRGALGAGRVRIARQLLTESILLASAGGLLGVIF
ncbi:MAG TPA: ABC transporter permease, partial [Bryobacteraceae bacterium]|nr:ABC transporter permease [Bryobacteraceae bacterium]